MSSCAGMGTRNTEGTANVDDKAPKYPNFTTTSTEYLHDVYLNAAQDADIEEFLAKSDLFDPKTGSWLFSRVATTGGLVKSMWKIVSSIVHRFSHPSSELEASRVVANVFQMSGNKVRDADGYFPYPDLVVRASGPSFEDPLPTRGGDSAKAIPSIGYSNIASFCIVRLESEMGTAKDNVKEMEKYAGLIFAQQPNRIYVRCLVLTEQHARLLHFDRAGAQVTPLIDIHCQAATFVRLIAGLASVNERTLGFDDSVKWAIVDGRKTQGTLTTKGPDGQMKTYPIIGQIPIPFQTYWGRGTVCWRVRDPNTSEELVVKDSWRHEDRPSEHEYLKLVQDIPGVVHMVAYDVERGETKDYRCHSTRGQYPNRAAMRTTMRSYGKSVEFFTSPLQVLCAIRDAIAGHQHIHKDLKILHRDISHNNILLGTEGASVGYRGILADFDTAFRATDDEPTVKADFTVGTRVFQSLTVLASYAPKFAVPAYDYLDELEAFFYVIVYIFLIHRPDGTRVSSKDEGPSIVAKWDNDDPSVAGWHKRDIYGNRDCLVASEVVERTWGPVCSAFYEKFLSWTTDAREKKLDIVKRSDSLDGAEEDDEEDDEEEGEEGGEEEDEEEDEEEGEEEDQGLETLQEFLSHRDEHYSEVLSIFDEAIEALRAPTTSDEVPNKPSSLDDTVDAVDGHSAGDEPALCPSTDARVADVDDDEFASPAAPIEVVSPSSVDTTPSTAPSSLEVPAPTTPPPSAPSAFAVYSNPSSPRLKRRSEDGVHPESPPTKGRRISEDVLVTNESPN